ncbi:hypothetical protein CYMTET_12885, partial [Cymbomonas tetramitiformis]
MTSDDTWLPPLSSQASRRGVQGNTSVANTSLSSLRSASHSRGIKSERPHLLSRGSASSLSSIQRGALHSSGAKTDRSHLTFSQPGLQATVGFSDVVQSVASSRLQVKELEDAKAKQDRLVWKRHVERMGVTPRQVQTITQAPLNSAHNLVNAAVHQDMIEYKHKFSGANASAARRKTKTTVCLSSDAQEGEQAVRYPTPVDLGSDEEEGEYNTYLQHKWARLVVLVLSRAIAREVDTQPPSSAWPNPDATAIIAQKNYIKQEMLLHELLDIRYLENGDVESPVEVQRPKIPDSREATSTSQMLWNNVQLSLQSGDLLLDVLGPRKRLALLEQRNKMSFGEVVKAAIVNDGEEQRTKAQRVLNLHTSVEKTKSRMAARESTLHTPISGAVRDAERQFHLQRRATKYSYMHVSAQTITSASPDLNTPMPPATTRNPATRRNPVPPIVPNPKTNYAAAGVTNCTSAEETAAPGSRRRIRKPSSREPRRCLKEIEGTMPCPEKTSFITPYKTVIGKRSLGTHLVDTQIQASSESFFNMRTMKATLRREWEQIVAIKPKLAPDLLTWETLKRRLQGEFLDLQGLSDASSKIQGLCMFLKHHPDVKRVLLSSSNLDTARCRQLAGALEESTTAMVTRKMYRQGPAIRSAFLCTLELGSCNLSSACIAELSVLLTQDNGRSCLMELCLEENQFGDQGAITLAKSLKVNRTLQYLNVSRCGITDYGTSELAKMLEDNASLCHLLLDWNPLRERGALALAASLQNNVMLMVLSLSHCSIGVEGSGHLANMLKTNDNLTELNLSGNRLDHSVSQAFRECLEHNSALLVLSLCENPLGRYGGRRILDVLNFNSSLKAINLSKCELTSEFKNKLDPEDPAGEYRLDLSLPEEFATAELLLGLCRAQGTHSFAEGNISSVPVQMHSIEQLPSHGILSGSFVPTAAPPSGAVPISNAIFRSIYSQMMCLNSKSIDTEWRKAYISLLACVFYFTTEQACPFRLMGSPAALPPECRTGPAVSEAGPLREGAPHHEIKLLHQSHRRTVLLAPGLMCALGTADPGNCQKEIKQSVDTPRTQGPGAAVVSSRARGAEIEGGLRSGPQVTLILENAEDKLDVCYAML